MCDLSERMNARIRSAGPMQMNSGGEYLRESAPQVVLYTILGRLALPPVERSSIVRDCQLQAFDGEH
jgi:hypothetical protein